MPAVANIVLPDAQVTPVNHTFIPLGQDAKGVWWYEDQTGISPLGFQRVSFSFSRPPMGLPGKSSSDRVVKVRVGIFMPRLETLATNAAGLTPAPTISYVPKSYHEFLIPERSLLQDRKDLRKYAVGLLGSQVMIDAVETLQNVF